MTRVLVVEDEAIICADIRRTLLRLGYDVPVTADSSDDAVRQVEATSPDLVLMDIKLAGSVDGIETVARIRRQSDVPVVYLTSHSDEATLARAKETGPHGYLIKPFNERDLRTAIEVALRKHELERELARRERWFSTTLKSLGDAVIATDSTGHITFINAVAQTLTGFSSEAAMGRPVREVFRIVDEAGAELDSPVARAIEGRFAVTLPPRTQVVHKDGVRRFVDDSATPILDDRGELLGGVVVFRDVTAQKVLEKRLETAQRLASLGTMAAGIAHEVNNPLTVVASNVSFVLDEMREMLAASTAASSTPDLWTRVEPWIEALSEAVDGSDRVQKIIATMRRFAGRGESKRETIDLPEVIDAALRLVGNAVRHKAKVTIAYGTTPLVEADEGQLVQVFLNLLGNAADAISDGDATENEVSVRTYTDDAGRAVAEVRDTGRGIPAADLARIFDPFFSTKGVGRGMGLGLSICHQFVAAADGQLTVESTVGKGSAFRVSLLPARLPNARAEVAEAKTGGLGPRARVLVVDDEPAVAQAIARTLRGHDVITETDPRVALARIAAGEQFDVFFCDVMMPGMTGVDVYEALSPVNPQLASKIVFLTGGTFSPRTTEFLERVGNLVVTKPFRPAALRELVAERTREQKS
jgi:two-component system, cell cycle sensor histidine kinase and response regulator CckA